MQQSDLKKEMDLDELRYSLVWEDSKRLRSSLKIVNDDSVLSIGSAGCNTFNLLLEAPKKITALDLSPAQIALINLKTAGYRFLTHPEFLALIGLYEPNQALPMYEKLRKSLDSATTGYFDRRPHLFERGLVHSGRLEKYFGYFREQVIGKLWPANFLSHILEAPTATAQWKLFEESGTMPKLHEASIHMFGREGLEKGRDASQMKYVTVEDIGTRFFRKFTSILQTQLIQKNPFLHYFILGKFPALPDLMDCYRPENFDRLKNLVGRLEVIQEDLETFLSRQAIGSYSKYNLSDIFEYMHETHANALFDVIHRQSREGARIAYWTLLVPRSPQDHSKWLNCPNNDVDQLWFYDEFHCYQKA